MDLLNAILTAVTELVFWPLRWLPDVLVLVIWAVLAGLIAGVAFRYTSNQRALAAVGDRIRADLLAMRLFKDELRVTLRSQLDLLRAAGLRFWYALPAFVAMLIPFMLLLVQLAMRYEVRPLRPGEAGLLEVRLTPHAWERAQQVPPRLEVPDWVAIETPPLRDGARRSVWWRLRPRAAGTADVRCLVGETSVDKRLTVAAEGAALQCVSPLRPGRSFWDRLLYPTESALAPDAPATGVRIHYPARVTAVFGYDVPWWVTFLVASILSAFVLKPFLKVRF